LLAVAAIAFCLSFADGTGNNWSAIYLRDTLGAGAALAAIATAVLLGSQTLGRRGGYGRRR
jgi:hypothetical protein